MYSNTTAIIIPFFFKTSIIKKNNYFLLYNKSKNKFFFLWINSKKIQFLKNIQSVKIFKKNIDLKKNIDFYQYLSNTLIKSWEFFFFKKFKFKSKGLKIKRRKIKKLKFLFWLSHINLVKIKNCKIKRLGKQKYLFFCTNWVFLKKICKNMQKIRPNDLFTKKGIRFGRQVVLKKRGKKITYI